MKGSASASKREERVKERGKGMKKIKRLREEENGCQDNMRSGGQNDGKE